MLVLSRQREETILIGEDIEITVVDIRGDKVRIGISAPRQVQVHRKEVYETITLENTGAAQVRVEDLAGADHRLGRLSGCSRGMLPNRIKTQGLPRGAAG
jgi:carbon storage regulator